MRAEAKTRRRWRLVISAHVRLARRVPLAGVRERGILFVAVVMANRVTGVPPVLGAVERERS
jgi:hypothetical protein